MSAKSRSAAAPSENPPGAPPATDPPPACLPVLPFGRRAIPAAQTGVLRQALDSIQPGRGRAGGQGGPDLAAFDLDSTLLDNRPRQARIVREFGARSGDARLAACTPARLVSWDLRDAARLCGLDEGEVVACAPALRRFWLERFFTSEYCAGDAPIAGAGEFLRKVRERGGRILYLTGRHEEMRDGTLESFRCAGFPLLGAGVDLWLKPQRADDDDAWKDRCHARLAEASPLSAVARGGLACAFDNEPLHVNAYKRAFPGAVVVHLDTDHSQRPVEVLQSIPSILDFRMEPE